MAGNAKPIPTAKPPKLISKKVLQGDERLFFESRQHSVVWKPLINKFIIIVAVDIFLYFLVPSSPYLQDVVYPLILAFLTPFLVILSIVNSYGLVWLFFKGLHRRGIVYAVTDKRVILKKGILFRNYRDLSLAEIKDVRLDQSLEDRMLGFGALEFWTEHAGIIRTKLKMTMRWEAVPRAVTTYWTIQQVRGIKVTPVGSKPNRARPKTPERRVTTQPKSTQV